MKNEKKARERMNDDGMGFLTRTLVILSVNSIASIPTKIIFAI